MGIVGPSYEIRPADPSFTHIPVYYSQHPTIQAPDSIDKKIIVHVHSTIK